MSQKRWVFDPDSGGKKIPESKKREVTQRIEKFAAENYAGKYTRLDIRFRGQFCYIDAYTEPDLSVFPDGQFTGKPEDAFAASAMYLE